MSQISDSPKVGMRYTFELKNLTISNIVVTPCNTLGLCLNYIIHNDLHVFALLNAQMCLIIIIQNYSLITLRNLRKLLTWTKANKNVKFQVAYITEVTSAEYVRQNRKLSITA